MKKIIAGLLCVAVVSGAAFAQEVTLYNKLGMTAVTQAAEKNAPLRFGHIYDEVRATYESDMFSLWGQVKLGVAAKSVASGTSGEKYDFSAPNQNWSNGSRIIGHPDFNVAFRPVEFLEFIAGTNAGDEGLWSAAHLPGAYGYGSDFDYGVGPWANGEGLTVAFRGAGIGIDGLTIGWNVLQAKQGDFVSNTNNNSELLWRTAFAVSYIIPELVGVGFGARINTADDSSQELGIYGELLAVTNLKVGLGVTFKTDADWYQFSTDLQKDFVAASGNNNTTIAWKKGTAVALNAGAEYNLGKLTIGGDLGMVMGSKEVINNGNATGVTVMPMILGGFVAYNLNDRLKLDGRVSYENPLASESQYKGSITKIEPRLWFNVTEADELRFDVPLTMKSQNNTHTTGLEVECYWKHSF